MSKNYFDRYQFFIEDGNHRIVPGIEIPIKGSDKYVQYKKGKDRLDKISQEYYETPTFGWLIMLANPEFGGLEFNIPDSTIIRVPFPYDSALNRYMTEVTTHKQLYGE